MSGYHLRERSPKHWAIVIDDKDPVTGKRRKRIWHSFRGTKAEAKIKAAQLITERENGTYVEPSKETVESFVRTRIEQWEASGEISARTAQRYRQLLQNQIAPYLGGRVLQRLKPLDIEQWHTILKQQGRVRGKGGVAAR